MEAEAGAVGSPAEHMQPSPHERAPRFEVWVAGGVKWCPAAMRSRSTSSGPEYQWTIARRTPAAATMAATSASAPVQWMFTTFSWAAATRSMASNTRRCASYCDTSVTTANLQARHEWARLDSNQGPTDYESAALTN